MATKKAAAVPLTSTLDFLPRGESFSDVDLEVETIEDMEQLKSELAEICQVVPAKGRWRSQNRSKRGRKKNAREFEQVLKEFEVPAAAEGLSIHVSGSVALQAVPPINISYCHLMSCHFASCHVMS